MKKLLYFFSAAMISMFAFTGCGDDDEPDFRDDYVGSYSGTMTFTYCDETGQIQSVSDYDTFVVKKGSKKGVLELINGTGEDQLTIYAEDLYALEDGHAFNLRKYVDEDGSVLTGAQLVTINGESVKYDGYFDTYTDKLYMAFYIDEDSDDFVLVSFEGLK